MNRNETGKGARAARILDRAMTVILVPCGISIVGIFFSDFLAEHRMQAIGFWVGMGFATQGAKILLTSWFPFEPRNPESKGLKGRAAQAIGTAILLAGSLGVCWGALFWIEFVRRTLVTDA